MDVEFVCPYCGESSAGWVDPSGGPRQRYIEDCTVCCQPIEVAVKLDTSGPPRVETKRLDE